MARIDWMVLALVALGLITACRDSQRPEDIGVPFNVSLVGYLQPQSTTRQEAEQWFGPPTSRGMMSNEQGVPTATARNAYLHASVDAYGSVAEYLEVEFNADGVLTGIYFLEAENEPPDT